VRRTFVALAAVVLTLGALDAVWLASMVPGVYRPQLGALLADQPVWLAAVGFYLLYATGLLILVVLPGLDRERSLREMGLRGALLGLASYGTYDLTNLATLRDWPVVLTAVDMVWGTFLTATVAIVAVWTARRLG
jgi:uncharacterized membrane protein